MKKLLLIAGFLVAGCAQSQSDISEAPKKLSDDFFVTIAKIGKTLPSGAVMSVQAVDDKPSCEQALTRAVCETTATTQQITTRYTSISCSADSAKYVPALMEIYDEMPEKMRVSLCSLDRVFISDGISSTAFASSVTDSFGNRTGGYVGMRKGTFLSQPTSSQIVSWKEQLAFGGSAEFLHNDPKLVQLNYALKMSTLKSDGLFYVLMHELGHLIDFNNQINSEVGPTSWAAMSWKAGSPTADASFYKRDNFCYYNCTSYLDPRDAKQIYSSLSESAFVTTYAASTPYEDFAEHWAWHMMEMYKSPNYTITIPNEGTIDMNEVFKSNAKIQQKIKFIDDLWNDSNLKIDNRQ